MAQWGEGAKGAMGGAVAGGAIGGPLGAGIGAIAGGALGMFGGGGGGPQVHAPTWNSHYNLPGFSKQFGRYQQIANQYGKRQAPTIAESGFRPGQESLVRMLQAQAAGKGPGQELVRMQAQQAADRAGAQQLAAAQGQVGSGAMGARNAALGSAALQSEVGGQAAMGGLAAQLGATEQLGGVLQGARGQDLSRGEANAGLVMQNRQTNDQAVLEALRQRLQASQMQQQGGLEYNRNVAGFNTALAGKPPQPSFGDKLMGFGIGVGSMGMMGRGGGGSTPYRSSDYGSTAFNPYGNGGTASKPNYGF
jgi:hypothetical protein